MAPPHSIPPPAGTEEAALVPVLALILLVDTDNGKGWLNQMTSPLIKAFYIMNTI